MSQDSHDALVCADCGAPRNLGCPCSKTPREPPPPPKLSSPTIMKSLEAILTESTPPTAATTDAREPMAHAPDFVGFGGAAHTATAPSSLVEGGANAPAHPTSTHERVSRDRDPDWYRFQKSLAKDVTDRFRIPIMAAIDRIERETGCRPRVIGIPFAVLRCLTPGSRAPISGFVFDAGFPTEVLLLPVEALVDVGGIDLPVLVRDKLTGMRPDGSKL